MCLEFQNKTKSWRGFSFPSVLFLACAGQTRTVSHVASVLRWFGWRKSDFWNVRLSCKSTIEVWVTCHRMFILTNFYETLFEWKKRPSCSCFSHIHLNQFLLSTVKSALKWVLSILPVQPLSQKLHSFCAGPTHLRF